MPFVYSDRVRETSTSTGTGTFNLGGAVVGFITFASGIGANNTCYYAIVHRTADEWEVGYGTLDGTGAVLTRTSVLASSAGGSAVTFSAGTKDVFNTPPAVTFDSLALPNASGTVLRALSLYPYSTTSGSAAEIRFYELAANGSNYVSLRSPDALSTNVPLVLPSSDGTSGQYIQTDGAGNLSWSTAVSSGSITSGYLGNNSVLSGAIASGQISHYHLSSGAAIGNISSGSIVSGLLANDSVVSGSIASGQIGLSHLSSGTVLSGTFVTSGSVQSGALGNASVVSGSIASGSVGQFAIASGSITAEHIASGAVINTDIADAAVTSGKIASGAIGNIHVANAGILSGNIGSGQISNFHLASGAVAGSLTSGIIVSGLIGNSAVVSGSIASGSINTFHISSGTITSTNIASGTITASRMASGSIVSGAIASGQIGAGHIASGVLFAVTNASDNRILTSLASGTNQANSEANLTFDGSTFTATSTTISGTLANFTGVSGSLLKIIDFNQGDILQVNNTSGFSVFSVSQLNYAKIYSALFSGVNTTSTIYSVPATAGSAAYFDYAIKNTLTSGYRAGTITATWDDVAGTIEYSDVSTNDLGGSTQWLTFSAAVQSGNINLSATINSGSYNIKIGTRLI